MCCVGSDEAGDMREGSVLARGSWVFSFSWRVSEQSIALGVHGKGLFSVAQLLNQ